MDTTHERAYPSPVLWTRTNQWLRHQHGLTDGHPGIALGGGPEHVDVTWVDRDGTWTPDGVVDPRDLLVVEWTEFDAAVSTLRESAWPGFLDAGRSWGSTVGSVRRVDPNGSVVVQSDEVPANAGVIVPPNVMQELALHLHVGARVAFSWHAEPIGSTNYIADWVGGATDKFGSGLLRD